MNPKKFNLNQEFKKIVKNNGNKIAVNFDNEKKYDFNFLDIQSNKLLLIFKKLKIKKGDIVAIDSEKNINSYILIIACLKNENPYSFIEFSDNNHRVKKILKTLNPKIIFTFKTF
jgi:acyl-coenzyme A synthetase/AMP-(fatty) acid ligase